MGVLLFVRRLLRLCLIWFRRSITSFIPWLFSIMTSYWEPGNSLNMGNDNSVDREEDFDSTWEDEEVIPHNSEDKSGAHGFFKPHRNMRAAEDMRRFRDMYREAVSKTDADADDDDDDDSVHEKNFLPNLHFYQNKRSCDPDNVNIDEIHEEWCGDYDKLEYVHSYIQWLFPTQEPGMNFRSYVLSLKEIKLFRKQKEVKDRLLKSYKLMLDFYGIELVNKETGEVKRAKNWKERFENLNRNTHNNLRITRILKCLGLLGFEHYQAPLVQFFLQETLKEKKLPRVKQSVLDYFMFSVLNKEERKRLIRFAFQHFEPEYNFVWCPRRIQFKFKRENHNAAKDESNNVCVSSEHVQNDPVNTEKENDNELQTNNPQGIQGRDNSVNSAEQNDSEPQSAQPQDIQSRDDPVNSAKQHNIERQRAQPQDIQSRDDSVNSAEQNDSESQTGNQPQDIQNRDDSVNSAEQNDSESQTGNQPQDIQNRDDSVNSAEQNDSESQTGNQPQDIQNRDDSVNSAEQNDSESQTGNQPQDIQNRDDSVNSAEQNDSESQTGNQPQDIQNRDDSVNSVEQNDSESQRAQPQDIQNRDDSVNSAEKNDSESQIDNLPQNIQSRDDSVNSAEQNGSESQRAQPQNIQSKYDPVNCAEQNDSECHRAQPQGIQNTDDSVNSAEQNGRESQRPQPQDSQSRNYENLSSECQEDGGESQRIDEDSKQEEGLGEGNGTSHIHEEGHEN